MVPELLLLGLYEYKQQNRGLIPLLEQKVKQKPLCYLTKMKVIVFKKSCFTIKSIVVSTI